MTALPGRLRRITHWMEQVSKPLRGGGKGWFVLFMAAGWFLTLGARFLIPAVLPAIKSDFGLGNAGAGLVVTVIWLTYGMLQYPAGALTDRLGERTLLTTSAVLAAVSVIAFALIPTYVLFLVAAAAFGTGTGLFGPARGMALSKTYDEHEGAAFGVVLAAGSIGAAVLPFIATLITSAYGWRLAVAVLFPAFVVVSAGLWWAVPDDLGSSESTESLLDGLRTSFRCLQTRRVAMAVAGIVVMLFVFQGLTAFYTTYLTAVKDLGNSVAGAFFALLFVSGGLSQVAAGRLADVYGYRLVLVGVGAFSVFPLVVIPFAGGLGGIFVVTVLIGVRLALGSLTNAYIIGALPAEGQGAVWGFIRTAFFAIGSLGSYVVGIFGDFGMFDEAMYFLAALTILGTVMYALIPDDRPT